MDSTRTVTQLCFGIFSGLSQVYKIVFISVFFCTTTLSFLPKNKRELFNKFYKIPQKLTFLFTKNHNQLLLCIFVRTVNLYINDKNTTFNL